MKFARYLQDTQTPEWKKAYIDYRGLKKQIGLIRAQQVETASSTGTTDVNHTHKPPTNHENEFQDNSSAGVGLSSDARPPSKQGNTTSLKVPRPLEPVMDSPTAEKEESNINRPPSVRRRNSRLRPSLSVKLSALPPRLTETSSTAPSQQTPLPPRTPHSPPVFPFFRDVGPTPPALHALLPQLPAVHTRFFELLDAELDKIESFYAEREKEMRERGKRLREQLHELGIHRRKFYESTAQSTSNWVKKAHLPATLRGMTDIFSRHHGPKDADTPPVMASESGLTGQQGRGNLMELTPTTENQQRNTRANEPWKKPQLPHVNESEYASRQGRNVSPQGDGAFSKAQDGLVALARPATATTKDGLDPLEYQHAKKRLKKAVVEFYRGLEVLNNYRILNLTGFRKALKKYEKVTKIPAQVAYMKEKVEPSAFASGAIVSTMLREMEDLFAARFERGDKKKAMNRLRVGPSVKSHHFSTFRSGLWIGLAIPAVVAGSYLSFQEHTRTVLPAWNIILFIYSILLIPVLFALLIGINILVWARERINYVFIFELDLRTRLDHREYFELPSSLLCALAYAYWFSFARIGPPLLWPLVWLLLVLVVMFNPIRSIMWGRTRWWIIKSVAKLGLSGLWTVEFTDFWLGDQFCSLAYSLSNLYFVGCFYTHFFTNWSSIVALPPVSATPASSLFKSYQNISTPLADFTETTINENVLASAYDSSVQDAWTTCGTAKNWGFYYVLGVLPFLARFVQGLRRYWDSRLPTHLINAGKYGMGMLYYFFYFYWRHQENVEHGASYILWCFTASVYAIYACAWDFLMDWSVCKPHARHPFLRPELVYTSQIPSYYFALVTNVCIRFVWVFYIPSHGPSFTLRTFVAAVLEMLRRVQWNFYRLENEHLGNMDQYRVTREVPLPYSFDMIHSNEDEDDEDGDADANTSTSWLRRQLTRDSKRSREVSEK